jgi:hypothetical protein
MRQTLVKKHLLRIAALACITGFLSLSGTMAFAADSTPAGHTLADRHEMYSLSRGCKGRRFKSGEYRLRRLCYLPRRLQRHDQKD